MKKQRASRKGDLAPLADGVEILELCRRRKVVPKLHQISLHCYLAGVKERPWRLALKALEPDLLVGPLERRPHGGEVGACSGEVDSAPDTFSAQGRQGQEFEREKTQVEARPTPAVGAQLQFGTTFESPP